MNGHIYLCRVDVEMDHMTIGPSVPQAAVVQRGTRSVVYVLESRSAGEFIVRERHVEVGESVDGKVSVTGVSVGDIVVLHANSLRDGMAVRPVEIDGGPFFYGVDGGGV